MKVRIDFFKDSGKWYTDETVDIPDDAFPWDLVKYLPTDRLTDMTAVTNGTTPWGYPAMAMRDAPRSEPPRFSAWIAACEGTGLGDFALGMEVGKPVWAGHRAACVSWPMASIYVAIRMDGMACDVLRPNGGVVSLTTPAELRAELDRLAQEIKR